MSVPGPYGAPVRALAPAPEGDLADVFPPLTPESATMMSRASESLYTAAHRIRSRVGAWRTRDGLEQVSRELDVIESEARRLRAILSRSAS